MTQTKKIVILDANQVRVIFTEAQHNPTDDMEVCVFERMEELGLRSDECVWMAINDDTEVEIEYPLQISALKN